MKEWPCSLQFSFFRLPATRPKLKPRGTLHYSKITESWCLPFMGSDKSVMTRTQRSFYHDKDQRLKALLSSFSLPLLCTQADPDPGLPAAFFPLLRPHSHLCWHPLWHPRQLQTGSRTPRWVDVVTHLFSSSFLSSEGYPGLCSFGKVSKDGVPKAKVSKGVKHEM